MAATNIEQVTLALERVVADAIEVRDPRAYFPALYRQVTLVVRARIGEGYFDDGERMAELVTRFANRYLDAVDTFLGGRRPTRSWSAALDATRTRGVTVLQHVLLGINAHINLDLGICVAEVYPGERLAGARADFDRINTILGDLMDRVEDVIERFSPLLHVLDTLGGPLDESLVNFSIQAARRDAWQHAELLAAQDPQHRLATIDLMDTKAAFLARLVAEPGSLLGRGMELVHMRESDDVRAIAMALDAIVGA